MGTCVDSCSKGCSVCQGSCGGGCGPCGRQCTNGCGDGCGGRCGTTCNKGCSTCSGTCGNGCGTCGNVCSKGCGDGCDTSCGTTCNKGCAKTCNSNCSDSCKSQCKGYCKGSCTNGCAKRCTVTTSIPPITSYWAWSFGINKGDAFKLTAQEWKRFLNYINSVRYNTGDGTYSFDTSEINTGKNFKSTLFNKAREIIGTTTNHGALPNTGEKGKPIYGENHFGKIRDSINTAAESVYNQGSPNSGDWGQQTDGT